MHRKPISLEVESDKRLIEYGSFGKYLDSLIDTCDLEYFQNRSVARTIAELGYRSSGIVLDRKSFKTRYKLASDFFYPTLKPLKLASESIGVFPDPLIKALALRERANLEGKFLTIIFLRTINDLNFEVSGFIDFRHRLKTENFQKYFNGKEKLVPKCSDLSYFHWRNNNVFTSDTDNFEVKTEADKGLTFFCKHDRKKIFVDPHRYMGLNTCRINVDSPIYEQAILYDHEIMRKVNLYNF